MAFNYIDVGKHDHIYIIVVSTTLFLTTYFPKLIYLVRKGFLFSLLFSFIYFCCCLPVQ